jgi:ribosomal protein L22
LGVSPTGQPPARQKKKLAKKPVGKIVKWVQEDAETLYDLLKNKLCVIAIIISIAKYEEYFI